MKDIKKKVFECLDNAVANGYDIFEETAEDIADDLGDYAKQFERTSVSTTLPHIKEWLFSKRREDEIQG